MAKNEGLLTLADNLRNLFDDSPEVTPAEVETFRQHLKEQLKKAHINVNTTTLKQLNQLNADKFKELVGYLKKISHYRELDSAGRIELLMAMIPLLEQLKLIEELPEDVNKPGYQKVGRGIYPV